MEPARGIQPAMPMDIEHQSFSTEFFATHIVKKAAGGLVSQDTPTRQDQPWKTAILGRAVQWYQGDNTSPDAINGIFTEKLTKVLDTTYRNNMPAELVDLKDRLSHLIENARAFENFKNKIFSGAYVRPAGLSSLETLIQSAEERKKQVEAQLASAAEPKISPRKAQLQRLNQSLSLAVAHLLKATELPEGIYRLSGESGKVKTLTANFLNLEPDELSKEIGEEKNIHNVSGAIKAIIRDLKPSLITEEFYPFFLAAAEEKNPDEKIKILKQAIANLPPENKAVLKLILTHLNQVSKLADKTKMGTSNLAIVWGPNLLKTPEEPAESYQGRMLKDMQAVNDLTRLMIENDLL